MPNNPLYYSLKKDPSLKPKTSKKTGELFFLIPLENEMKPTFVFQKKIYFREEHHISIFEKFSEKKKTVSSTKKKHSPIHVTTTYRAGCDTIIIHSYFDEFGNYMNSTVTRDGIVIPLSPDEEIAIRDLIMQDMMVTKELDTHFKKLLTVQKKSKDKKDLSLLMLEKESHKGTRSTIYRKILDETIAACHDLENLEFYPSSSVSKFLQAHRDFLDKSLAEKHSVKSKSKIKQTHHEESEYFVEDMSSHSFLSAELIQEAKAEPCTETPDSFVLTEAQLYHRLEKCSPNDLNSMLMITKELDKLAESNKKVLIEACITGNQELLARHWNPNNAIFTSALLATCIYHNHQELFDWIDKQNKLRFLWFSLPFIQVEPLVRSPQDYSSFLDLAYQKNYLSIFNHLLKVHRHNPNEVTMTGRPLLTDIVQEKGDIAYIRALLEAGANPNLVLSGKVTCSFEVESKQDKDAFEKLVSQFKKNGADIPGLVVKPVREKKIEHAEQFEVQCDESTALSTNTALHYAACTDNIEAIKLLIEYHAKSDIRNFDNFTPFGVALFKAPMCKAVLKIFLENGHDIDEKNGPGQYTGLLFHCQTGYQEGVKILLELQADPCAHHKIETILNGKSSRSIITPLCAAANKKFPYIVEELLQYKIPSKEITITSNEIRRAILVANDDPGCCELLRKGVMKAYNQEAINAFKAKNFESAQKLFGFALQQARKGEEKHSTYYNLGACLSQMGKLNEAELAFLACLEIRKKLFPRNNALIKKVQEKIDELACTQAVIRI